MRLKTIILLALLSCGTFNRAECQTNSISTNTTGSWPASVPPVKLEPRVFVSGFHTNLTDSPPYKEGMTLWQAVPWGLGSNRSNPESHVWLIRCGKLQDIGSVGSLEIKKMPEVPLQAWDVIYFSDPKVDAIKHGELQPRILMASGLFRLSKVNYEEKLTVRQAILRSGGFTTFGDVPHVYVVRCGELVKVDIRLILDKARTAQDVVLQPWDVIYLPQRR